MAAQSKVSINVQDDDLDDSAAQIQAESVLAAEYAAAALACIPPSVSPAEEGAQSVHMLRQSISKPPPTPLRSRHTTRAFSVASTLPAASDQLLLTPDRSRTRRRGHRLEISSDRGLESDLQGQSTRRRVRPPRFSAETTPTNGTARKSKTAKEQKPSLPKPRINPTSGSRKRGRPAKNSVNVMGTTSEAKAPSSRKRIAAEEEEEEDEATPRRSKRVRSHAKSLPQSRNGSKYGLRSPRGNNRAKPTKGEIPESDVEAFEEEDSVSPRHREASIELSYGSPRKAVKRRGLNTKARVPTIEEETSKQVSSHQVHPSQNEEENHSKAEESNDEGQIEIEAHEGDDRENMTEKPTRGESVWSPSSSEEESHQSEYEEEIVSEAEESSDENQMGIDRDEDDNPANVAEKLTREASDWSPPPSEEENQRSKKHQQVRKSKSGQTGIRSDAESDAEPVLTGGTIQKDAEPRSEIRALPAENQKVFDFEDVFTHLDPATCSFRHIEVANRLFTKAQEYHDDLETNGFMEGCTPIRNIPKSVKEVYEQSVCIAEYLDEIGRRADIIEDGDDVFEDFSELQSHVQQLRILTGQCKPTGSADRVIAFGLFVLVPLFAKTVKFYIDIKQRKDQLSALKILEQLASCYHNMHGAVRNSKMLPKSKRPIFKAAWELRKPLVDLANALNKDHKMIKRAMKQEEGAQLRERYNRQLGQKRLKDVEKARLSIRKMRLKAIWFRRAGVEKEIEVRVSKFSDMKLERYWKHAQQPDLSFAPKERFSFRKAGWSDWETECLIQGIRQYYDLGPLEMWSAVFKVYCGSGMPLRDRGVDEILPMAEFLRDFHVQKHGRSVEGFWPKVPDLDLCNLLPFRQLPISN